MTFVKMKCLSFILIIYTLSAFSGIAATITLIPELSVNDSIFSRKIEMKITAPESCIVYYTKDGRIPTRNDIQYYENTTLRFDTSVTITAKAFRFYAEVSDTSNIRWEDGGVVTAKYVKKLSEPEVTLFPVSGKDSLIVVMFNHETGAELFYTTDGTIPDTFSSKYTDIFEVTKDQVVKVITFKQGSITSDVKIMQAQEVNIVYKNINIISCNSDIKRILLNGKITDNTHSFKSRETSNILIYVKSKRIAQIKFAGEK